MDFIVIEKKVPVFKEYFLFQCISKIPADPSTEKKTLLTLLCKCELLRIKV